MENEISKKCEGESCAVGEDTGNSLTSFVEDALRSTYKAVVNNPGEALLGLGIGGVTGGLAAAGIAEALKGNQTAKDIATGAAIGGAAGALLGRMTIESAAVGAAAGAVAGAAAELIKKPEAEAAVIGAGIAAGAAAAVGAEVATRGIAAATGAAISLGVMKVLEGMKKNSCCPGGCCPCTPMDMLKEVGDHIKNRPGEALAEAAVGGAAGVVGGALLRRAYEKKDCCSSLQDTIKDVHKMIEKMVVPKLVPPLMPLGTVPIVPQIDTQALEAAKNVGVAAAKAAAAGVNNELEQHRAANPVTSAVERGIGYAAGGLLGGKAAGTVIELGDIQMRKNVNRVKALFGY